MKCSYLKSIASRLFTNLWLFYYNKDFLVDIHGMPKFHMTDCRTIQKFRRRGTLNKMYYWSNAPKVLVTQRNSSEEYPDTVLILCRNCSNEIVDEVHNQTDEEFAHHQFAGIKPSSETDVFGRPLNWRTISRAYRRKVNFTCEQCGFGGADLKNPAHRMFLDTHHINGYNLTDTSELNLRCLCKLCHTYQDAYHVGYLKKGNTKATLNNFTQLYTDILRIKNPKLFYRHTQGG